MSPNFALYGIYSKILKIFLFTFVIFELDLIFKRAQPQYGKWMLSSNVSQAALTCSKSKIETVEQGVKYIQS